MDKTTRGLVADPLFVGATRPPMRWGVTYSALLFNLVFTLEAFLVTRNLLTLLLALPIHGASVLLCGRDARYFDLLLLWGRTRVPALLANGRWWGASSYSPLVLDPPRASGRRRADVTVVIPDSADRRARSLPSC
ncbi:MAG TPA: VirB3 family type IV secretion system protein [Steroidobacteraceae bacterium]|nr:VirB3 family type IV secretion system protein [Steroidobacteraceae bacterium]